MKRLSILITIFFLGVMNSLAQDVQFSQFSAAPLYLNPAFAGSSYEHRFSANYRVQWPNLPKAFNSYALSYDYNMPSLNSGFGLLLVGENAGSLGLQTTSIGLVYSYKLQITDNWVLSPGIQFSYTFRNLSGADRIQGFNQLNFGNPDIPPTDPAFRNIQRTGFVDLGAGFLIHNKNMWLGFAAHHINRPDNSLNDSPIEQEVKYSIHGGYRIPILSGPFRGDKKTSIAPAFLYKSQGAFDQLDLGIQLHYEPISFGIWYRGIPIQQEVNDQASQDAVVFVMGLQFAKLDVGYSYDFTVSGLGANTGGAHEISFMYRFNVRKSNRVTRKEKFVPCPSHY
ncbi:MAG: type IX secretion system membrane protein PorP/SprF [Bacteroidota bacterium]